MLRCGPSNLPFAATAKSRDGRIHRSRDTTDIRYPAFADAASPRRCGTLIAALRSMSPYRPLKASLRRKIQTALSLHAGSTIEERDDADIHLGILNGRFERVANLNKTQPNDVTLIRRPILRRDANRRRRACCWNARSGTARIWSDLHRHRQSPHPGLHS